MVDKADPHNTSLVRCLLADTPRGLRSACSSEGISGLEASRYGNSSTTTNAGVFAPSPKESRAENASSQLEKTTRTRAPVATW